MRIMINSNILLSAIIFRSANMLRVIDHASSNGNELVLSSWALGEVRRVVAKKWPGRTDSLEALLLAMRYELVQTPPNDEIEWGLFTCRNPMDYPTTYSAAIAGVDLFVTEYRDFAGVDMDNKPIMLTSNEYVSVFCP